MPSYHVSPMGDPTLAGAVSNLAQVFAPKQRTIAAGELAGAQVRKTRGQADQIEYQNQQISKLAEIFAANPELAAVLGAGQGNAQQMAGAVGAFRAMDAKKAARDKAVGGDYTGAAAEQFYLADKPVAVNDIDSGYQINPYVAGGTMTPTGKTLAEIVTQEATTGLRHAQANSANAAAGASNARAAKTRDEMANPERYRAPPRAAASGQPKPTKVSPNDVKALDKLIGQLAPAGSEFPTDVRNDVLTRAAANYQQTGNAQQSVADAFAELTSTTPAVDTPWYNPFTRDQPAKVGRKAPAAPAPAAPQAAPQEVRQLNGKTYVKINGQWFEQ